MISKVFLSKGYQISYFFPIETISGLNTIKAMSEPFAHVRLIPTDGVQLDNTAGYLQNKKSTLGYPPTHNEA
jgi:2-keto-3-deoxy-6-phosphogluconate aldolase